MIKIVETEPLEFEASIPVDMPLEITYHQSNGTPYIYFSQCGQRISTAYSSCSVSIFGKTIKKAGEAVTRNHISMINNEIEIYHNMKYALLLRQYVNI